MSSSALSSPEPTTKASKTSAKVTKVKRQMTKPKSVAKASKVPPTHPSWKDIIKECISAHPDDARAGVSRNTIKKYADDQYGLEPNPTNVSHLARAIATGAEELLFALPKGPAGKVKLYKPPRVLSTTTKVNTAPVTKKATAVKKDTTVKPKKSVLKKDTSDKPKQTSSRATADKPKKRTPAMTVTKPKKAATTKTKPVNKVTTKKAAGTRAKKVSSARAETKKSAAKAAVIKTIKKPKPSSFKPVSNTKPISKTKPASKAKSVKA